MSGNSNNNGSGSAAGSEISGQKRSIDGPAAVIDDATPQRRKSRFDDNAPRLVHGLEGDNATGLGVGAANAGHASVTNAPIQPQAAAVAIDPARIAALKAAEIATRLAKQQQHIQQQMQMQQQLQIQHQQQQQPANIIGSTNNSYNTPSLPPPASASSNVNAAVALAMAKAQAMQAQIASQIASASKIVGKLESSQSGVDSSAKKVVIRPLVLDDFGNEIDEFGNIVKNTGPIKTIAINKAESKPVNPYLLNAEDVPKSKRELLAKNTFKFIDPGQLIEKAEKLAKKEEGKVASGYASGRKIGGDTKLVQSEAKKEESSDSEGSEDEREFSIGVPLGGAVVPSLEWWDESFLPKDMRVAKGASKMIVDSSYSSHLNIENSKTYKLVYHPVPIKALCGESLDLPLPTYLTKAERKRIRKTARAEKEQEKRDKQMMGLIPPPEPKFKLSNFMKILGDQAVADPSKVERRVVMQIEKRKVDHLMRNESNKLTPQERREKKWKKNFEDTSREVHVALFRIDDISHPKHRFKLEKASQQYYLTGIALSCLESKCSLVQIEGGPKGIRKFSRLILERVQWSKNWKGQMEFEGSDNNSDDESGDESEDMETNADSNASDLKPRNELPAHNYCAQIWSGITAKRAFPDFKFQTAMDSREARKFFEARNLAHYWDFVSSSSNK